jgi:thiol-disulfide isomerase/thioredoxin
MNKVLFLFIVALSASFSFSQKKTDARAQNVKSASQTASVSDVKGIHVVITGQVFNAPAESLTLSLFRGNNQYEDFGSSLLDQKQNGTFLIKATVPVGDFYVLRAGTNHINLIITNSDTIKVFGDGRDLLRNINIIGNPDSQHLLEFLRAQTDINALRDSIQNELAKNPMAQNELGQLYQSRYKQFEFFRDRFIQQYPNSPALIAPMQTYNPETEFTQYSALAEIVIAAVPDGQVAQSLRQNVAAYRQRAAAAQLLAPGNMVPELEGPSPDGTIYRLSSLKGKVVLIDFWASWCGPCRKENPAVVALYEKYKDKGFTVFSVSLDSDKNAWMRAIESDKLVWPYHISELKRWDGMLSRSYGVNSIPFTVLIDAEGKVIDKNLRGSMLEEKLHQIFGF